MWKKYSHPSKQFGKKVEKSLKSVEIRIIEEREKYLFMSSMGNHNL